MIQFKDKTMTVPIIQGGMGVGVSLGNLAGHVALNGGMGVISTAQIGFKEDTFLRDPSQSNLVALKKEIKKAKEIAKGKGIIAINAMVALSQYKEQVETAVKCGVDAIISGAGLPMQLPEYVDGSETLIAPIVSSGKAIKLVLRTWAKKYHRTADFVVIEGSLAGGHLGFHKEDLINGTVQPLKEILKDVLKEIKVYEEQFKQSIPVFVAGGIYTHEDIKEYQNSGASGVQIGTRFIATNECDAHIKYKEAFINATQKDIELVTSPVGMPGRAIQSAFMNEVKMHKMPIKKCYQCITSCHVVDAPYCITQALINAVKGDVENGLIFSGANGYRINKIVSVKELISELMGGTI